MERRQITKVVTWLLSILVASAFLLAGLPKLLGRTAWIKLFSNWGYPRWFLPLIGALEVLGAILLLIPRFAIYAILILSIVMLGAAYTHLANAEGIAVIRPLIFLCFLAIIGWLRRPRKP